MGPEFHISIREALTYVFLAALLLTPMIASYSSSLSDSIAIISPVPPSEIPESIEYVGCSLPLPDSNYSYIIILNLEECEVDPHIIEKWIWNHTNYNIIFIIDQSSALYLAGEDRRLLDIPITALQPAPVEAPPPIGEQSGKTLTASHIPGTNITALYAAENNSKIFFLNEKISIQDLLYQLISSSQMEKQQNNITAGNPTTGSPGSRGNMLASPAAILTISALSITTITLLIKMYYFEKYKKIKEKIKKLLSYIL
ncbi:MAG: hypothetical protein F7C35_08780, partial [Desulfurococcales archaeon]|nr:hypothetical protein [Desulfurococcales archaeon]